MRNTPHSWRTMLAAIPLAILASSSAPSCTLLVDADQFVANGDAGPSDMCGGESQPPARVTATDEPGSETYVAVLRDIMIDQGGASGGDPMAAPWRTIGFNLDGFCTTDADMRTECSPAGQGLAPQLDGVGGIDNTFGNSFFPVVSLGLTGIDVDLVAQEQAGIGAPLLLLDDWNGAPNDSRVTVTFTQSVFGTPAGPGGGSPDIIIMGSEAFLTDGTTPAPAPAWNGTDYFWGREDTFIAGDPQLPNVRVTTAYVTNGVLVARLPDRTPIRLLGTAAGIEVNLTDLVITGNVHELFVNPQAAAPQFVLAGRWGFNDLVAQAPNIGVCEGTALFTTLNRILNGMIDVLQDPPAAIDSSLPCDALSVGIVFNGYAGHLGGVAEGQAISNSCP